MPTKSAIVTEVKCFLIRAVLWLWPLAGWAGHACLPCHEAQVRTHLESSHARSLRPVADTEFYRALPAGPILEAHGGFALRYARLGRGLLVTAERGPERVSALLVWAFGAGVQGVTPVGLLEGVYIEHRISYYARPARFDLTLGHEPGISANARTALGLAQMSDTIHKCFGCHATAVTEDLRFVEPGVQCERCHPGAQEHAQGGHAPFNAGRLPPRELVRFCADCHRSSPPGNPADPINIRFQPYRLMMSRCYAAGKLSCVNCHDPHTNARREAAFYEAQCLSCHARAHARGNCLPCHMPRSSPAPYLTFTDHYIRKRIPTALSR